MVWSNLQGVDISDSLRFPHTVPVEKTTLCLIVLLPGIRNTVSSRIQIAFGHLFYLLEMTPASLSSLNYIISLSQRQSRRDLRVKIIEMAPL